MKIITWNCNGAFRNKYEHIISLNADILIIQECENPAESKDVKYQNWAENYLWIGDSKNKGLGVFTSKQIELQKLDWSNGFEDHNVKHFIPCSVNGNFNLLAIWTHQNNSPNYAYIGQFWKYFQVNKNKFENIIIAGDFNSNTIWDKVRRTWNHSDVVRELSEIGIESLYHHFTYEDHGLEQQPTFYLHKNLEKPYHIDYCFASEFFIQKFKNIEIGDFVNYKVLSDHNPVLITFEY